MSFILEALKKSEKKYRRKGGEKPRTIHESVPHNSARFRSWMVAILILLVINTALLFWFFGDRQKLPLSPTTDISLLETPPGKTGESVSASPPTNIPATENNIVSTSAVVQNPQMDTKEQPAVIKPLPTPHHDQQVYRFGQLPVSIQKQIPPLQMSLHAYNRTDANASMVQMNDRIIREGDAVTDNIRLEQITADGVVLSYDGYLFLLPRRGNRSSPGGL